MDLNNLANFAQILSFVCDILFGGYVIHIVSAISKGIHISRRRVFLLLGLTVLILFLAIGSRFLALAYLDQQPGTMDLQIFCSSLGYQEDSITKKNDTALCITRLTPDDLNAACVLQYGKLGQTFHYADPNSLTSGYCEDAAGNKELGVDLNNYCNTNRHGGTSEAVPIDKNWQCQLKINMDIVCAWMYGTTAIQARKTNVTWSCYKQPRIF
jgi:hypothetical protein